MRIATWNVNSIRARVDRVCAWLERTECDVLAIQETKCKDAQFPFDRFTELGYEVAHLGHNQWNGVAIISRVGLSGVQHDFPGQPGFADPDTPEARAIGATCNGVTVWSLYVPNGRAIDDRHYLYKLDWLARLRDHSEQLLTADPTIQVAFVGDWNIAPLDEDVWSVDYYRDKTHTSPAERAAFAALAEVGYREVTRAHTPGQFSYWDYTQLRFPRREGMRIDLAYAAPALAERVVGAAIDREERKGKGASDHAPVIIEID
ncbi:MAG: exodeoxyribonuclease III [Antricoccus sp.]